MSDYAIYLRKSRADLDAEARGEGETLARHKSILLALAKKMNIIITKIYEEVVSGETIASRPLMQQLLSDVEQGLWDGILVMEIERLARGDTIDQGIVAQTFKYSRTKIITPMKVYDPANEFDEEYFEFGLFMSRREYKTINRRLQQGKIQSAKEGKFLGSKPPYGYVRKKLQNDKGYTLEIHPEQANTVRMIFELYTKGDDTSSQLGPSLIANKLNELRIEPMKGNVWTPSSIREILRNPVYIGKIRWNNRPRKKKMIDGQVKKERPRAKKEDVILVEGLHERIIDQDIWDIAQEYNHTKRSGPVPSKQKVKNPLSGLVACGMCGRNMVRRPYPGEYPDTLMCPVKSCNNVSSKLYLVEEKLLQALDEWLKSYKLNLELDNSSDSTIQLDLIETSIKKLDNEITTLQKQMNSLHDLLEQGVYTVEMFLERSKFIKDKIDYANSNKIKLEETIKKRSKKEENKKNIIPKIEKVLKAYNSLKEPAAKNELLKEVLVKTEYTKTTKGRWHGKEDDFELLVEPKIPE